MSDASGIRLPRYRRATSDVSLLLTERDIDILAVVESHRLLTSCHVKALVKGSDQQILRRMQKLYHAGYLDRIRPRWVNGGGSASMVYAITNRGVRLLFENSRIKEPSRTDVNAQNRGLHDFSIRHQLLVSHVRTIVELACQTQPGLRLVFWKEDHDMYDSIEVVLDNGYTRVPIAPDAYFALEDGRGRLYFFLEADRGTMKLKRFTLKLKAYAAYRAEAKHTQKLGIRHFRVLTVTTGPDRIQNLVSAAEAESEVQERGHLYLFAEDAALSLASPERVLGSIWTAVAGGNISLIPEPDAECKAMKNLKGGGEKK